MTVTPRLQEEAKMLVHRHFGHSRRHTELEKKKVHEIVAKRLLVIYNQAENYLKRLDENTEYQKRHGEDMEDKILVLLKRLKEFIRYGIPGITNSGVDLGGLASNSDSKPSNLISEDVDLLDQYDESVGEVNLYDIYLDNLYIGVKYTMTMYCYH